MKDCGREIVHEGERKRMGGGTSGGGGWPGTGQSETVKLSG